MTRNASQKKAHNEYMNQYYKDRSAVDPKFVEAHASVMKKQYQANKEKDPLYIRRLNLRKRFGLTIEQYEQMFDSQKGLCAICKRPETILGKNGQILPLSVDHNHATGEVRKLLCNACNRGLGSFEDSVLSLLAAVEYLQSN